MDRDKKISSILVFIQFSCLAFFAITAPVFAKNPWLLLMELGGIFLGIWAIWVMQPSRVSIFPLPGKQSQLIQQGPYKVIRHPMYAAIFLAITPLLIESFSLPRLAVYILLITNQLVKMLFEEKKLREFFPGYPAYMKKTKRVIPFLF
jgi:protein-S-isoprenylcysteine O-methyltransferase Ste14